MAEPAAEYDIDLLSIYRAGPSGLFGAPTTRGFRSVAWRWSLTARPGLQITAMYPENMIFDVPVSRAVPMGQGHRSGHALFEAAAQPSRSNMLRPAGVETDRVG